MPPPVFPFCSFPPFCRCRCASSPGPAAEPKLGERGSRVLTGNQHASPNLSRVALHPERTSVGGRSLGARDWHRLETRSKPGVSKPGRRGAEGVLGYGRGARGQGEAIQPVNQSPRGWNWILVRTTRGAGLDRPARPARVAVTGCVVYYTRCVEDRRGGYVQ